MTTILGETSVSRHLEGIIEPLSPATCKLLVEVPDLAPRDYLEVTCEDDVYEEGEAVHTKRFVVRILSNEENSPPSYRIRNEVWWRRIPDARPLTTGEYGFYAPPSDVSALIILAAVGRDRIVFTDEVSELEFMTLVMTFAKMSRTTKAPAGFKNFHTVPLDAPTGNSAWPPMPAQRVAAWAAERSEAYALWMEQSTGKTYAAIMAIESACKRDQCQFVCITCPKNVRTQWQLELERFSSKRIRVFRFTGSHIDRLGILLEAFKAKLSKDYDIVYVITSYQLAVNNSAQISAYPWDWLVADEAHFIKAFGAKRTKNMLKLRDKAKRRLALTGTPITNSVFDLYTQLEFLGRGWSGFASYEAFKRFHGSWEPAGRGLERLVSLQNIPLLQERLARSAFLLTKKEALPDLPAKTYTMLEVDMTPTQWDAYNALATKLYLEIERDIAEANASGKTVTVNNILTRLLRLSQVTSGFLVLDGDIDPETGMIDPKSRLVDRFDPNPKLEELVRFLKEDVDDLSKVIIWCCYTQDIKTIKSRLDLEKIKACTYYGNTSEEERVKIEFDWNNDPSLKVFIGNPAAGGVGLNLQGWCKTDTGADTGFTRADTVVFFSQNWSAVTRSQGEERPRGFVHESKTESGKRESWPIHCVDLCVPDSIDLQIRNRVTNKRMNAATIQDIREILAKLLVKPESGD